MHNKIRTLLADDHMLLRMGLSSLIGSREDMSVVGEAETGKEAVELTRKLRPDVVIMDLMMPEMSGAEATKIIHREMPNVKVIILTSFGTSFEMSRAIADGAACALMKDADSETLIKAIRDVYTGKTIIAPHLLRMSEEDADTPRLTDHQIGILTAVTQGLTNNEIALRLNVTLVTVKKQLKTIFAKIGAANRTEAVAIALRKQLVKM